MTRNRKRFWGAIWSLKTGENKVQLFDAPNSPFNSHRLSHNAKSNKSNFHYSVLSGYIALNYVTYNIVKIVM